jgi:nitroreductase
MAAETNRVVERAELEFGLDDFASCVRDARSVRVYDEGDPVERELLLSFVDLARQTASAANRQTLRYHIVTEPVERERVFACLGWAAYLKDWDGPASGERPSGYIVVFNDGDPSASTYIDLGIAAQTMVLAASETGIGACMLRNFGRSDLKAACGIDCDGLVPMLVVSFGTPAQKIVMEPMRLGGDVRYWVDEKGVHHVPKLTLGEIVV